MPDFEVLDARIASALNRIIHGTQFKRKVSLEEQKAQKQIYETEILRPETAIMEETPWSRIRGQNSVDQELLENVGNGKPTGSVLKETIAVSCHDINQRGKVASSNPSPNSFMQQNERKSS